MPKCHWPTYPSRTLDRLPSLSWHEHLAPLDVPAHAVLRTMPDWTTDAAIAQQQ